MQEGSNDWKKLKVENLLGLSLYIFISVFTVQEQFQASGMSPGAKWFVPGSRHYSWDKGANILGTYHIFNLKKYIYVKIFVPPFSRTLLLSPQDTGILLII